ncbi:hypothetical protein [Pseudomonas hunanensis]|uniref:hypothetical protein n=1 Tax=Pseudomonas hunanensis TaxID=1247546 RepID=UPI0030DC9BBB
MVGKSPWEAAIEVEAKTDSERYLNQLARRAVLSFWCYGNVHTDEGKRAESGDGKELCDLLVVFGNHILIFSDKHCEYPKHEDPLIAWRRWYRRAIDKSVMQLIGAEKFIREHPDRLYLDKQCTVPFPYRLPEMKDAVFHRIAVTRGSYHAAVAHWGGQSSGSLMIDTSLVGKAGHSEEPFTVGRPAGKDRFVHVLDELTLDVLLGELDTVPDLVSYFSEKERFLNSVQCVSVPGEEELVALYQTSMRGDEHTLPRDLPESAMLILSEGEWRAFDGSEKRRARNAANRLSYLWDHMIEYHCGFIRSNETVSLTGVKYSIDEQEHLVRALASETRFGRRMLATAFDGLLKRRVVAGQQATRTVPSLSVPSRYCVFTVVGRDVSADYQDYRESRAELLTAYCTGVRLNHPDAREVIGIATEPLNAEASSQDFFYEHFPGPATTEELAAIRDKCDELGVLQEASMQPTAYHAREFPEVLVTVHPRFAGGPGNRAERRAAESVQRRKNGGKRGV